MTRKHYIILASVLKKNNADFTLCCNMAGELYKDNPLFDIDRFLDACGYPSMEYLLSV